MSAELPSLVARLEAVATRLESVASGGAGEAGLKTIELCLLWHRFEWLWAVLIFNFRLLTTYMTKRTKFLFSTCFRCGCSCRGIRCGRLARIFIFCENVISSLEETHLFNLNCSGFFYF